MICPSFKQLCHFSLCPYVFLLQCCNLLLVETLKDPLCFKVSDQTIPKQQHIVQVSVGVNVGQDQIHLSSCLRLSVMSESPV